MNCIHPELQARGYATELVNQMQRDPGLCHAEGRWANKLITPYGWGSVLANIERKKITDEAWDEIFAVSRTLTREDLEESVDPGAFQARLWGMFTVNVKHTLTLPQRDRVRWHLFPEIRIQTQASLLDEADETPAPSPADELLQVMDLQQETLARSLGDGHRVVHGVAGSGKTMLLVYRAMQLAAAAKPERPILVLCYNRPLSARIDALLRQRGVDERVQVRTFHSWCEEMVRAYQLAVPVHRQDRNYYDAMVDTVIQAIDHGRVPRAQYCALMIDEAHDFEDAWLRLAPQLIDPDTKSLLVLYDDAQSIYRKPRRNFSFASVGIEARGRTSVLKVNYRNTSEVLALATRTAGQLLGGANPDADDEIAHLAPMAGGRRGPVPELMRARGAREEADLIAERLNDALADGVHPSDIGILARRHDLLDAVEATLRERGIASQRLKGPQGRAWAAGSIKLTTLHASKGLEFHTVAIVGLQAVPDARQAADEEWRLLYVAMTRASHRLVLSGSGDSAAVKRVGEALSQLGQAFQEAA